MRECTERKKKCVTEPDVLQRSHISFAIPGEIVVTLRIMGTGPGTSPHCKQTALHASNVIVDEVNEILKAIVTDNQNFLTMLRCFTISRDSWSSTFTITSITL
jgi:hypothetical protein